MLLFDASDFPGGIRAELNRAVYIRVYIHTGPEKREPRARSDLDLFVNFSFLLCAPRTEPYPEHCNLHLIVLCTIIRSGACGSRHSHLPNRAAGSPGLAGGGPRQRYIPHGKPHEIDTRSNVAKQYIAPSSYIIQVE